MKPHSKHNTEHYHALRVVNIYRTAVHNKHPHTWILARLAEHYQTPAYQALSQSARRYVAGANAVCLNLHYLHLNWYHVTSNGTFKAPLPSTESYQDIKESFDGYDETHRF